MRANLPEDMKANPHTGGKDDYFPFLTTTVRNKITKNTEEKQTKNLESLKIWSVQ